VQWIAINSEPRARRVRISASPLDRRVRWSSAEVPLSEYRIERLRRLDGTHPDASRCYEDSWTAAVEAVKDGLETIETQCSATNARLRSTFFVQLVDSGRGNLMARDWLRAIADGFKAIPGAGILINPLLTLRDEEKSKARNGQLDALLASNVEISKETLASVLMVNATTNEVQAGLELLVPVIKEAAHAASEQRADRPAAVVLQDSMSVTRFPLPISMDLIIDELNVLFPSHLDMDDFRACLSLLHAPMEPATTSMETVRKFVVSLRGRDRTNIGKVFTCLADKRPQSEILCFAKEFLTK
jgi:hypothetical protein